MYLALFKAQAKCIELTDFNHLAQDTGYGSPITHPTLDTAKTGSLAVIGSQLYQTRS
jgi:hypothetical protein